MQLGYTALVVATALVGCAVPPPTVRPTPQTDVPASFDRTWSALVDFLTTSAIPIKTTDKASGLATTEEFSVEKWDTTTRLGIARCGMGVRPQSASLTFVVRGDSTKSSVRATARFRDATGDECTTTHALEQSWETEVRKKAEPSP